MSSYLTGDPLDRPGVERVYRVILGATPAVGQEISIVVPGGEVWEVISLLWLLTTGPTVANRRPGFTLDDGETVFYRMQGSSTVAASSTQRLTASPAYGTHVLPSDVQMVPFPGPPFAMLPGWRIRSSSAALQGDDQYSEVRLLVRTSALRGLAAQRQYEQLDEG